ncbi:MAG: hypothetical protein R3C59_19595 [Planctomycetaceae bacterium]
MKRFTMSLLLLGVFAGLNGCASMMDGMISCEMGIRNSVLAHKAWGHWSWCYDELDYPYHFGKGFRAGYRNILDGGNGCQPTLPPQCYWKPHYQTPEGHCMTHAWFDGFSHGALAAKQDGYGYLGEIPISPTAQANFERARQRRTNDPAYPHGAYGDGTMLAPSGDSFGAPEVILPAPTGEIRPVQEPVEPSIPGLSTPQAVPPARSVPMRPYE